MSLRVLLISIPLLGAGVVSGATAADNTSMGHSVYGSSGHGLGGALYVNVFPYFAEVNLDGNPIGVANDLQASLVDARVGVHALTVTAPGYQPATVLVRVVRDWTMRVRLALIPAR